MRRTRLGAWVLLIVGACAVCYGICGLVRVPDVLQYTISAEQAKMEIGDMISRKDSAQAEIADALAACTVYGIHAGEHVSYADQSATATFFAVDRGYFEIFPDYLKEGRLCGEGDCVRGAKVCVLDEKLAFALFRSEAAIGKTVDAHGEQYEVVGVTRYRHDIAQKDEYRIYVPLAAVGAGAMDTYTVAGLPLAHSGAGSLFSTTVAGKWIANGYYYSTSKESMRGMILPRIALLVGGIWLTAWLYMQMGRLSKRRVSALRQEMTERYFKEIWWKWFLEISGLCVGYGLITLGLYELMDFSIQPLYTFTEWVPECIVEWESLESVYKGLLKEAANLTDVRTMEVIDIRYYAGFARWGVFGMLGGAWVRGITRKAMRK